VSADMPVAGAELQLEHSDLPPVVVDGNRDGERRGHLARRLPERRAAQRF